MLDEAVVASGNSPKQLEDNINAVVPEDKRNWIYKFRL